MGLQQFQVITFHRVFVDITGSINAALMLSNAIYWTNRLPKEREGWFYKTKEEWTAETGLSRKEQDNARKQLTAIGILETRRAKISETDCTTALWFRVNTNNLHQYLNVTDQKPQTDVCQKSLLDPPKAPNGLSTPYKTSTTTSPPPPPRARAEGKIPMSPTWTPSDSVYPILHESNISPDFAAQCLPEFRLFWMQREEVRNNWESVFVRHVRNEFTYRQQQEATKNDRSTASQGSSRQSSRGSRESISERLDRYERFINGNDASKSAQDTISGEFIRH